jgi:hypothetical protein
MHNNGGGGLSIVSVARISGECYRSEALGAANGTQKRRMASSDMLHRVGL